MPPDADRLQAVFHAAVALADPAERAGLLDRECGDDIELRRQVERLLQAHDDSGELPAAKQPDAAHTGPHMPVPRPEEAVGAVLGGKYKLLQAIGEGGMGAVYLADQLHPVKRRVAVKLIRAGMDSGQVLARFEAERQALALMDHPHIAKVLDAGTTESSQPFFVMELVKGVPVTEFCDQHKLGIPERLTLFMQICSAVQHAHQKGIIHRDLKPSNILVESHDGKPVPKVIDFGLAKATSGMHLTEHTLFTALGQVVGTPLYMAPEQAAFNAIDVDTRADIYALGVLLYELLTGTTPIERQELKKQAFDEILRIIRDSEPPTPSKRLSSSQASPSVAAVRGMEPAKLGCFLRGDLDWIVMKALSKERDRRYETANGFAKDIERFLKHEPVLAGPPSAGYRLRKFVRRNRPQVIAGMLVLLALLVGMAGTTFGLLRAHELRGLAVAKQTEAEQQKDKAEQAEADTLASFRASTDEAIEQLIGSKPVLGPQEKTYLERTLKRWQAFADRKGDDKRSQALRAEGHFRVAYLWQKLDRRDEARQQYEKARDIRTKLVHSYPSVPAHSQGLAITHNNLGALLADLGKPEEARTEFKRACELQQKLTTAFPTAPAYQQELASTHDNLGGLLVALSKWEEAHKEYEKARDIRTKLVDAYPRVPAFQHDLAVTHNHLGVLQKNLGKWHEARKHAEKARDLGQALVESFPAVPAYLRELAATRSNLGLLLVAIGQRDQARKEYENARDLLKSLADAFPAVPDYQRRLASIHTNLGNLLAGLGKRDEALEQYLKARDFQQKLVESFGAIPAYQEELAMTHNNLGIVFGDLGLRAEALREYEKARDISQKLADAFPAVGAHQVRLGSSHNNLGVFLTSLGKRNEAREEFEKARDIRGKLVAASPAVPDFQLDLSFTLHNLGALLDHLGESKAGLAQLEKARDIRQQLAWEYPAVTEYQKVLARTHNNLGTLFAGLGRRVEGRKEHEKARDLQQKLVSVHPTVPVYQQDLANTRYNLGILLSGLGERDKARTEYEKARALLQKLVEQFPAVPAYQRELGSCCCNLGNLTGQAGKFADSLLDYDEAIRVLTPVHQKEPRDALARDHLCKSHWGRAWTNDRLKRPAEAVKDWDRTVELSVKSEQPVHRLSRANARLRAGQAAESIAEVAELTQLPTWTPSQRYTFACIYAVASGQVADKKQEYADRAIELLHKAVKAGYKDAARMMKDSDLDALRDREDFHKLLADLAAPKDKKPGRRP